MNRIIAFLFLLVVSSSANAAWVKYTTFGSGHIQEGSPVADALADCKSKAENLSAAGYAYQCRLTESGESSAGEYQYGDLYYNNDASSVTSSDLEELTFNYVYTDEQCDDLYTGAYTMTVAEGQDTVDLGSCSITTGGGDGVGVCTINDNGSQNCAFDWVGSSTGEVNTIDLDGGVPTDGTEVTEELPDYLSESSDGGASCATGSVTLGGSTYCVDTSSVTVTDLNGNPFTGGGGGGDGDGDGDGSGDGSGDGDGETDGQCDPETDGECEGESTECLPGMSCYVPTDAQVEAKFFDYFPGSVDNTQVTEYDASDFELDGEYESGLTSGSCPAPVPVTLALGGNSHTFEITFEFFCQFALLIRGLVLASCSFLAANIIYRGVVTLV